MKKEKIRKLAGKAVYAFIIFVLCFAAWQKFVNESLVEATVMAFVPAVVANFLVPSDITIFTLIKDFVEICQNENPDEDSEDIGKWTRKVVTLFTTGLLVPALLYVLIPSAYYTLQKVGNILDKPAIEVSVNTAFDPESEQGQNDGFEADQEDESPVDEEAAGAGEDMVPENPTGLQKAPSENQDDSTIYTEEATEETDYNQNSSVESLGNEVSEKEKQDGESDKTESLGNAMAGIKEELEDFLYSMFPDKAEKPELSGIANNTEAPNQTETDSVVNKVPEDSKTNEDGKVESPDLIKDKIPEGADATDKTPEGSGSDSAADRTPEGSGAVADNVPEGSGPVADEDVIPKDPDSAEPEDTTPAEPDNNEEQPIQRNDYIVPAIEKKEGEAVLPPEIEKTVSKEEADHTRVISGETRIKDKIYSSEKEKERTYSFQPVISGTYYFEINSAKDCAEYNVDFCRENEEEESDYICGFSDVISEDVLPVEMNEGETYLIRIKQVSGFGDYDFLIRYPKEAKDISGFTGFRNSMTYWGEKHVYLMTPEQTGCYRFDILEIAENKDVHISVFSEDGDTKKYEGNKDGLTVRDLQAEITYKIVISQYKGLCSYNLQIGRQKETVNLDGYTGAQDSIQYQDQLNRYELTAEQAGIVHFQILDMEDELEVDLLILDEDENEIKRCHCSSGETEGLYTDIEKGGHLKIWVQGQKGTGGYLLSYKIGLDEEVCFDSMNDTEGAGQI